MPRKKMRGTRNQKRKTRLDDDANVSHSESTTNMNKSESWECPVSAKKNLIPNLTTTFNRRRTLRSSTRPDETGTSSLRRSSRRHSSAPIDIQQLDDTSKSNTMNSAHQVSEGSDQVEIQSPSRYLVSVAYPHDDEPELGHKEAVNVENSTRAEPNMEEVGEAEPNNMMEKVGEAEPNMREEVGEAEPNTMEEAGETEPNNMMEEVGGEAEPNMMEEAVDAEPNTMAEEGEGEAEKSMSNHAEKKTFEKESIPLEQESMAGGITNKNQRKCNSRVGCSSPFRSLKLTEMVEMVGMEDDEEEEVQSHPEDPVKRYKVKEELMPILIKIIGKYGDIAKNCVMESVEYRSLLLEMICRIISEFEKKDLSKIKEGVLKKRIDFVDGIKKMNVEVEWLLARLIDVLEARELLMQSGVLKEKTDQNKKLIQESESALEKFQARKKELEEELKAVCDGEAACKENLARAKNDSVTITRIVGFAKSKVQRFLHCSVVDGLI
ncbi:phospholipase-like protein [Trifolium pratense]|uniref:Phospholipase-like protein n=1 Tax=Trifolium pratense TaxID=57577 RepID=A0A2K3LF61_TRIPR|nr:phospholipase-like protein [Trifolium pratense]